MSLQANLQAPLQVLPSQADTSQIEDFAITFRKLASAIQNRVVNIRDFGATGDGVTDDRPAIQAAIDSLTTANPPGGILRIPKGVYLLSGMANFFSLRITRGNILIQGDGPGQSVLRQKDDPFHNLLEFIHIDQPIRNIGVTGITFQGFEPPSPDNLLADSTKCALLTFTGGGHDQCIENLVVTNCVFRNPSRDGVQLAHVRGARFINNSWLYFDGFPGSSTTGAHRVGIFSGAAAVEEIVVVGNNFNGKVGATAADEFGADGFVWFSKGGYITVSSNTLRNYMLEATQINAGPAIVNSNVFETLVGNAASGAMIAWPDTANTDPGAGSYIISPTYTFSNNIVRGGALGVKLANEQQQASSNTLRATVANNMFQLDPTKASTVIAAQKAFEINITGNIVRGCTDFFNNTSPSATDPNLHIERLLVQGNIVEGCTRHCLLINNPLVKGGLVRGNILSAGAGSFHVFALRPPVGSYELGVDDNVFVDSAGQPVMARIQPSGGAGPGTVKLTGLRQYWDTTFPSVPSAGGYRAGDVVWNSARSVGGWLAAHCVDTTGVNARMEAQFGASRGVSGLSSIPANTAGTPRPLLPELPGQQIIVIGVEAIMSGPIPWTPNALDHLLIRTTRSLQAIAAIPALSFRGGITRIPESELRFVQGAVGTALPAGEGIEIVGVDAFDALVSAASGSPVTVAIRAVYVPVN